MEVYLNSAMKFIEQKPQIILTYDIQRFIEKP